MTELEETEQLRREIKEMRERVRTLKESFAEVEAVHNLIVGLQMPHMV